MSDLLSESFYIEFILTRKDRFKAMYNLFTELRNAKLEMQDFPERYVELSVEHFMEQGRWSKLLDEPARTYFQDVFDLSSEQGQVYTKLWEMTESRIRISHPMFIFPGNLGLESLVDSILSSEYMLESLAREDSGGYKLHFTPWNDPFGGTDPLVVFIEAFGGETIYDSWHDGPHLRVKSGWDFKLAKQLVTEGKGFAG